MAARRPFWKWHRWKSIGFCLWPPSTCIWNLKLKFQSKLDLCSGNHVVYRQTDRRTDKVNPVYPPPTSLGGGIKMFCTRKSQPCIETRTVTGETLNIYCKLSIVFKIVTRCSMFDIKIYPDSSMKMWQLRNRKFIITVKDYKRVHIILQIRLSSTWLSRVVF